MHLRMATGCSRCASAVQQRQPQQCKKCIISKQACRDIFLPCVGQP